MTEPLSIGAIVEAIEKLFGKVGAAALIASGAFFLIPPTILAPIGINSADPTLRKICGIVLMLSAATCFVALCLKAWPAITRRYTSWRESRSLQLQYFELGPEARVMIAAMEMSGEDAWFVPRESDAAQDIIDANILFNAATRANSRVLIVKRTTYGREFCDRHRAKFRPELAMNREIADRLGESMSRAAELGVNHDRY